MLLRFRVTNHRSIRDTAELVLTSSTFEGVRPKRGGWASVTNRIAGIFGPNASGKTTVLDAMHFAVDAIRGSAHWGDRDSFPYRPFLLDDGSRRETSAYEFDFTIDDTRHVYGFESSATGVASEWLHSFPEGRRRALFERNGPNSEDMTFSRNLKGENVRISRLMGRHNLYLSTANLHNHTYLRQVHRFLARHLVYAEFSEFSKSSRLAAVKNWIEDKRALREAQFLLRFADLGIQRISLEQTENDERTQELVRKALGVIADEGSDMEELVERVLRDQEVSIHFWHTGGPSGTAQSLEIGDESSGTIAWLSLAFPALREIRNGGVLLVDELDSSLHPKLASALIALFQDPEINVRGAQLVFTSHDTSLLGHLAGAGLSTEETWFTEKSPDGVTEIYPLTDFPVKKDHNVERRYLGGRYGAVPTLAWEELLAALREEKAA